MDSRLIASAIAVACMLVDHLPEFGYNTFHDPGSAAMLSIVFANSITLAIYRGSRTLALVVFVPLLFLKLFIQPVFWVHNASFWVILCLLLIHVWLGYMAARGSTHRARLRVSFTALSWMTFALFAFFLIGLMGSSWIHFYIQLAAARIMIPCAFWTAIVQEAPRPQTPSMDTTGNVESA